MEAAEDIFCIGQLSEYFDIHRGYYIEMKKIVGDLLNIINEDNMNIICRGTDRLAVSKAEIASKISKIPHEDFIIASVGDLMSEQQPATPGAYAGSLAMALWLGDKCGNI